MNIESELLTECFAEQKKRGEFGVALSIAAVFERHQIKDDDGLFWRIATTMSNSRILHFPSPVDTRERRGHHDPKGSPRRRKTDTADEQVLPFPRPTSTVRHPWQDRPDCGDGL